MKENLIKKAAEIIGRNTMHTEWQTSGQCPNCVLILQALDGYPTGSIKSPLKAGGIEWIAFCDSLEGNTAKRVRGCNKASVCFGSGIAPIYNITLTGKIEITTDPAIKREMAYSGIEEYFPKGAEDPNLCILLFKTERYNIWNVIDDGDWDKGVL